jgi:acyl-CoA thioester hydrolase
MPVEALREFPLVITIPVQWGDQDTLGHVNNIIYLRWSETGRVEYLSRLDLWHGTPDQRFGPILASIICNFRYPLTYPDTVHVGTRVVSIGNRSFQMTHKIVSENAGVVAADLESTLVWLDYEAGKSIPVPAEMREAIEKLEGRELASR